MMKERIEYLERMVTTYETQFKDTKHPMDETYMKFYANDLFTLLGLIERANAELC